MRHEDRHLETADLSQEQVDVKEPQDLYGVCQDPRLHGIRSRDPQDRKSKNGKPLLAVFVWSERQD